MSNSVSFSERSNAQSKRKHRYHFLFIDINIYISCLHITTRALTRDMHQHMTTPHTACSDHLLTSGSWCTLKRGRHRDLEVASRRWVWSDPDRSCHWIVLLFDRETDEEGGGRIHRVQDTTSKNRHLFQSLEHISEKMTSGVPPSQVATELGVATASVHRRSKSDCELQCLKQVPVQRVSEVKTRKSSR